MDLPVDFWNADKACHLAAYAWLAFPQKPSGFYYAISMILLGISLELGQYFIPGRSCSFLDIVANSLGLAGNWRLSAFQVENSI